MTLSDRSSNGATAKSVCLQVSDLDVGYGKTQVLRNVSITVGQGEVVALIGANGAGKTTLLRAISGLLRPMKGSIVFEGRDITGMPARSVLRLGLSHCPEERHVWPEMTVQENLQLGAFAVSDRKLVEQRLGIVYHRFARLKERHAQLAGTLSGGEQQMLAIGRALMSEPTALLLDEPSLGLSPKMAEEVFAVIDEISRHGVTVLLVEQNVHHALTLATRAYVFESGRVTASDSASALLANPAVLSAYLGA